MRYAVGEREAAIGQAFVTLADSLVDAYDTVDLLCELTGICVKLGLADAAGILLGDVRRELRAVASSEENAKLLELLQLQNDQGPCLDCYQSAAPVDVTDLTEAADRWPQWVAAVAQQTEFRAVHALPLRLRGQAIGALNLFSRQPGGLSEQDVALAQALADVATIGILQERALRRSEVLTEQLQAALDSRVVIEQAKGVLSQHGGIDVDAAFDTLRGYARAHNLRLSELARMIVVREIDPTILLTAE